MLIFPDSIKFDPIAHEYYLKTRNSETVVPGVSHILSETGVAEDYSGANREVMLNAQRRGTRVHRAIELYDNGDLDDKSVHYEDSLFFDNYLRFAKDYPCFKPIYSEKQFYYSVDGKRYCGTVDKVYGITPGTIVRYGAWASLVEYYDLGLKYTIEMPNDEFIEVDEIGIGYIGEEEEDL